MVDQGSSAASSPARRAGRIVAVALAAALIQPPPAVAQRGPVVVRDTEIEQLLREYATPIFRAAGIRTGAAKIILIGDRSFNAFVANGQKIFINTGALLDAETPNEVIGVLAHETGHIAGGHLARLRDQLATAQVLAVAGMLLGAAGAIGASRGGVGNSGTGMMGAIAGPQELVRRSLLSYQRSEEQAADRAALNYLNATKQSPKGIIRTFKRFSESGLYSSRSLDPYLLSHPMPMERIANLTDTAQKSPYFNATDSPALQLRHDMMRAKIAGFLERPETVARTFAKNPGSLPARYAIAIANYRNGRLTQALPQIDALIREQPNNPYFHELKGQALLESGHAREALAPLRRAVALAPSSGLIRILLGQALVATNDDKVLGEAISMLSNAAQRDPDAPEAHRHLATAYARKGDIGMAELQSAEYYFKAGEIKDAQNQAHRAKQKLKEGTPAALRADDILSYVPPRVN